MGCIVMRSEHIQHIAAWYPSAPVIAGVRLRPLTLGHWRILEAMDSPFASRSSRAPTLEDVRAALCICSLSFKRAYKLSCNPYHLALVAMWRCRKASVMDSVALNAYFNESWFKPERYVEESGNAAKSRAYAPCCGAAIRIAMAAERAGVKRLARCNVESVWDVTIAEALWIISCSEELSGAELESSEDLSQSRGAAEDVNK